MSRVVTLAGFALLAALVVGWSVYTHRRPAWWTLPELVTRFTRSHNSFGVIVSDEIDLTAA